LNLLENGFGNLDLWAVESFEKVMEILTAQIVRTLKIVGPWAVPSRCHLVIFG
jgi:hypothetical protein